MKVVVDTNVFVSSLLSPGGKPRKVIDLWRFERFTLCLSRPILAEYFRLLQRLGLSDEPLGSRFVRLFEQRYNQLLVTSLPSIPAVPDDPDDDKFIECAVAASADFIVSGDRHLLALKSHGQIPILTPAQFLRAVQ